MGSLDSIGNISLWDLRKTDKLFNQIKVENAEAIAFHPNARALMVGAEQLKFYDTKTWTLFLQF